MLASLRRELRALLELFLIPGFCALLPWPLGFRWLRFCSRFRWMYRDEWTAALAQARQFMDLGEEDTWARQFRLGRLVDHADLYLSMTRSDRWMARYVDGWNDWPGASNGVVVLLYHWCPGFWVLRAMRHQGATVSALIAPLTRRSMGEAHLAYWYGRLRMWEIVRANGRPLVYPEGAIRRLVKVLKSNQTGGEKAWVCGMPDVPPSAADPGEPVRMFGQCGYFSTGLISIARLSGVPVVSAHMGLELRGGRRDLTVLGPFDPSDPALLQQAVDAWEARIRDRPWGYFLWAALPALFVQWRKPG